MNKEDPLLKPFTFPWLRLLIGVTAVLTIGLVATTQGAASIPITDIIDIILSRLLGIGTKDILSHSSNVIVWEIRLPRIILAALVGAALSMSGAVYQGLFRNPLADPYLIGVAGGAGLGATIILISPIPAYWGGMNLVPLSAFIAGIAAVTIAYILARTGGVASTTTLILAGVAITSLASSGTTFLLMNSDQDVRPVLAWLFGSFASSSWQDIYLIIPYLIPSLLVALAYGRVLNVMQLDEQQGKQLGLNIERIRILLISSASLATAAAVSVSGLIGFVGLIAPHTTRLIWGHDHRSLLPMSMIVGAIFLIIADLIARISLPPNEFPVSIITALVGAPFFLYLLRQKRNRNHD